MKYELSTETPPSELIALRAVVEPRFMQASSDVMMKEMRTDRNGMFQPGVTWVQIISSKEVLQDSTGRLTCAIQPENGKPLSLANDHSCREAVATSLMQHEVKQTTTMDTMALVAAKDRVPL